MSRSPASRLSIFSQPIDRTVFVAFFLGGVVPLGVLVYFAARYAPALFARPWLAALTVSVAVLSLGSFLALRRVTRRALDESDRDNRSLRALLRSSTELSQADQRRDVQRTIVATAAQLAGAGSGFFVLRHGGGAPEIAEALGRETRRWVDRHGDAIRSLAGKGLASSVGECLSERLEDRSVCVLPVGSGRENEAAAVVLISGDAEPLAPEKRQILSTLAGLGTVAMRNAALHEAQRNFFTHVTNLLVTTLDSHLPYQTAHSRRVAHVANLLGRHLGLDEERLQRLHFAALLHDIGMVTMTEVELLDPEAQRTHPVVGYEMLRPIDLWRDVAELVRRHHEWYDGGGYPDGVAGDAIPMEARIIGVAEAFDSMTAEQSYRRSLPVEEAVQRVREGGGGQFDPEVASALVELVGRGAFEALLGAGS